MSEHSDCYDVEIIFGISEEYLIYISKIDSHIVNCICYKTDFVRFDKDLLMYKTKLTKIKKSNMLEIIKFILKFVQCMSNNKSNIGVLENSEHIISIPDYFLYKGINTEIFFKNGKSCKTKDITDIYKLDDMLLILDFIAEPVTFHTFVVGFDIDYNPNITYNSKNYVDSTYFDILFGDFCYKTKSKSEILEYIKTTKFKKYDYIFDINDAKLDEFFGDIIYECENFSVCDHVKPILLKIRNDNYNNKTCDIVIVYIDDDDNVIVENV